MFYCLSGSNKIKSIIIMQYIFPQLCYFTISSLLQVNFSWFIKTFCSCDQCIMIQLDKNTMISDDHISEKLKFRESFLINDFPILL